MFCILLGWGSGLRAMEGEVLAEDELLRKLRDSRCRFQRRMQQLIEKVRPLPLAGWRGKEEGWEVEAGTVGQRDWSGWGTEGLGWGLGGGASGLHRLTASRWRRLSPGQGFLSALRYNGMPLLPLPQYNQPFEDGPVIQMSTLTYQTPQGTNQHPHPQPF